MPTPLPIDAVLPALCEALRRGPSVVLEAPPGAGKTTRVPAALLDAGLAGAGEVVVLEPRRLAARLSARRVAQERGEQLGETVGYQVRFEDVSSARTRLRYVTEGILTRRLLADPLLRGVGAVVLDEFHERHLPGDVALALLVALQRSARPDLKLVVMSATLDAEGVAQFLGCPALRSEGRRFPVDVEHLDAPDERRLGDQVAAAVRRATVPGTSGDTLVFLPGAAEIRFAQSACAEIAAHRELLLLPLHGDLPPAEQDRALSRTPQRKVILSTNVAETSVTIEGVTVVIDSGLARVASHSAFTGLPRLEVAKVSRASAAQRAGRAGRLGPGRCLRLYTRADHDGREAQQVPELLRADLAATVLELRAAGQEPQALPWLDDPPQASLEAARTLLQKLACLDSRGEITQAGRACAKLPLHPRLSRLVLEANARGAGAHGCALAALLSERDLRSGGGPRASLTSSSSDLLELLDLFLQARRARFSPDRLRGLGVDPGAARRTDEARARLVRGMQLRDAGEAAPTPAQEEALRIAALAAFPDRVCRRRAAGSQELTFSSGGAARLSEASAVREAPFLVAADAEERRDAASAFRGAPSGTGGGQRGVTVRLASAIEPEWLLDLFPDDLRESVSAVWEPARERVEVLSRLNYGSLVLSESRRPPRADDEAESAQAAQLLAAQLRASGARTLNPALEAALDELRARLALVAQHCPDAGLRAPTDADVETALGTLLQQKSSLSEVKLAESDLPQAVLALQGESAARTLSKLAPLEVALASGRRLRVEYSPGQPPAVRSRLQDFFGSANGPSICAGRVPLVLHLLAPNGRAQQVTTDLKGFWTRHYPAVRKELMRKYPRHPWPEDGSTASPPPPAPPRRR